MIHYEILELKTDLHVGEWAKLNRLVANDEAGIVAEELDRQRPQ